MACNVEQGESFDINFFRRRFEIMSSGAGSVGPPVISGFEYCSRGLEC